MKCPFCQGHVIRNKEPETVDWCEHYFEDMTCEKCQTPECSLSLNFQVFKDETKEPILINYWLKYNGYTAVVGVERQWCEITQDWYTEHTPGGGTMSTICHMWYKSEDTSPHLTPANFPDKLKIILVFS